MIRSLFLFLFVIVFFTQCATTSNQVVSRVSTDTQTDYSGKWNDTDADIVAKTMIDQITSAPWLNRHVQEVGERPVLIVGNIRNETMEHIDTDVFIKDLEREMINSGRVTFVANMKERLQVREERSEQQQYASYETAKRLAQEIGADYMIIGNISSILDETAGGGQKAISYSVNLELVDIETNQKMWIGNEKIKKIINRRRFN